MISFEFLTTLHQGGHSFYYTEVNNTSFSSGTNVISLGNTFESYNCESETTTKSSEFGTAYGAETALVEYGSSNYGAQSYYGEGGYAETFTVSSNSSTFTFTLYSYSTGYSSDNFTVTFSVYSNAFQPGTGTVYYGTTVGSVETFLIWTSTTLNTTTYDGSGGSSSFSKTVVMQSSSSYYGQAISAYSGTVTILGFTDSSAESSYLDYYSFTVYMPEINEVLWIFTGATTSEGQIGGPGWISSTGAYTGTGAIVGHEVYDGIGGEAGESVLTGGSVDFSTFTFISIEHHAETYISLDTLVGGTFTATFDNQYQYLSTSSRTGTFYSTTTSYKDFSFGQTIGTGTATSTISSSYSIQTYSFILFGPYTSTSNQTMYLNGPSGQYTTSQTVTFPTTGTFTYQSAVGAPVTASNVTQQDLVDYTHYGRGSIYFQAPGAMNELKRVPINDGGSVWLSNPQGEAHRGMSLGTFQPAKFMVSQMYGQAIPILYFPGGRVYTWHNELHSMSYSASWDSDSSIHLTTASSAGTSIVKGTAITNWQPYKAPLAITEIAGLRGETGAAGETHLFLGTGAFQSSWEPGGTLIEAVGVFKRSLETDTITLSTQTPISTADFIRQMPYVTVQPGAVTWEKRS